MSEDGFASLHYRGGNVYEGWFYTKRRPGDERKEGAPGEWLGAMIRGVLVDAKGRCSSFKNAKTIYPDEGENHE
jgi:hypothetical protein